MKQILIVDDEAVNRLLLKTIIENIIVSAKITEAINGFEAFKLCNKQNFDLVFMDIRMPIMNGVEATIKIREIEKISISKIIAVTAYTINDIDNYVQAKFDAYLSKPVCLKKLESILQS